mgnify:CR=1 FL=1
MGRVPMLPEIESLPGTQGTAATTHRHSDVRLRQDAANVRRHVVRTFGSMNVNRVAIRHLPGHEGLKILQHGGVRIFAEHQGCARVTNEDLAKAGRDTGIPNDILHITAEFVASSALCTDLELVLRNHGMYGSPYRRRMVLVFPNQGMVTR